MGSQSNQLKNYLIVWIIFSIIGVILFLLPALYDVQPDNTAIALFVVGVLIAGIGLVMAIIYSVKIIKQGMSEPQLLRIVEWTYTKEEWKQYCVQNLNFIIKSFFKMFYFIIIIGIIIDILLFFLDEQNEAFELLFSEIFIFSIIVVYPLFIYLINIKSSIEVKIFESAVMVSGVLYSWEMPQGKLIDIELISENIPLINFEYSSPLRRINTFFSSKQKRSFLSVPVPSYELSKANEIVNEFQKRIEETQSNV